MIGNRKDAQTICDHVRECEGDPAGAEPPDGWYLLSEGGFRYVYLSPEDVVYKVDKWEDSDHNWGNRLEARNLEKLAGRSGILFTLPQHTLYELDNGEVVMAMEFIASSPKRRGISTRQSDMIRQAVAVLTDMHMENYITRAAHDDVVVVDAGCTLLGG